MHPHSATTHQHWRLPIACVSCGIPLLVNLTLLPQGAAKVMLGEEELFGTPLAESRKDTVMTNNGLEPSAKRVTLEPVYYPFSNSIHGVNRSY